MAPLREYSGWNTRESETGTREPYNRYYILCEGENTEKYYFQQIINIKKLLGISPTIEIKHLEKTGSDRSTSDPKSLIKMADDFISEKEDDFNAELDKIIIVFDLDIYEEKQNALKKVIESVTNKGYLIAVTNPSFELFLLLHKENSVKEYIKPNENDIVKNEWVVLEDGSRKRFVNGLFCKVFDFDPKSSESVSDFAKDLKIAINQEKSINQDYTKSHGVLTSNIGLVMENIINNK